MEEEPPDVPAINTEIRTNAIKKTTINAIMELTITEPEGLPP